MKEINEKKLDNMEMRWTTFPSDIEIMFSFASSIKTRMMVIIWNNEESLSEFSKLS